MKNDKKSLGSRWLSVLLGIALLVGAWLVVSKPSATFRSLSIILGVILSFWGLAGIFSYYQHREKARFKQKTELALAVLLLIIGLVFLIVPGLLGDAIKWLAAAAFFVTAAKSLWSLNGIRQKYPRLIVFGFAINILLLLVSVLIVTNLLPLVFTLPLLVGAALALAGINEIILSLPTPDKR